MKNLLKLSLAVSFLAMAFMSCKKQETQVVFEGGTSPALTAASTAPLVLLKSMENSYAEAFTWTNPNYNFNSGVSSQNVTYTLQFDTTGSNFSSPSIGEKSIQSALTISFTHKELNTILLAMGLKENMAHQVEVRVRASLANNSVPLYSNTLKITITPYLDVKYPVPANLWVTGSATPLSWQCGCAGDNPNNPQKFTQTNAYTFELTIHLNGGGSYLFLPQYGDWSHKYAYDGPGNGNNVNGDNFIPDGGGDILAPAASGNYKIVVDFKTGKFTVTPA